MSDLKEIKGKIEAIGQSTYDANTSRYSYLRFLNKDGETVMIKDILTPNTCNSYIENGNDGIFHFMKFKDSWFLFAVEVEGRKVYDESDILIIMNQIKTSRNISICNIIFGLLTTIILIGIPLLVLGIISLKIQTKILKTLNKETIDNYLKSKGFSV